MLDAARLDQLLDQLAADRFEIGVRERLAAHQLVARLVSIGAEMEPDDRLRAMLSSLLARDARQTERFAELFGLHFRPVELSHPTIDPFPARRRIALTGVRWRRYLKGAMLSLFGFMLVFAGFWYWPRSPETVAPPRLVAPMNADATQLRPGAPAAAPATLDAVAMFRSMQELAPNEAPTLRELHAAGWPARAGVEIPLYRLARELELPIDQPLPVRLWQLWAGMEGRLALLAGQRPSGDPDEFLVRLRGAAMELRRDLDATLRALWPYAIFMTLKAESLQQLAATAGAERQETNRGISLELRPGGGARASMGIASASSVEEAISLLPLELQDHWASRDRDNRRLTPTPEAIDRALALAASIRPFSDEQLQTAALARSGTLPIVHLPVAAFADAAWKPRVPDGVILAPAWLAWVAAGIPLLLASFSLARRGSRRFHYLRNRMPSAPPEIVDLLLAAPRRLVAAGQQLHRVAQALDQRVPEPTRRLDPRATVEATARAGGLFKPVLAETRRAADYLVLLETGGPGDQEAARLDMLVRRLAEAGANLERYLFVGAPRQCYPELGAPPVSLDALAAQKGDWRLVVIGEGRGLIDEATLKPQPWTETLKQWERRALLTPKLLDDWGRNEFILSRELELPLGRASAEGLFALAELLGLDGRDDRPLYRVTESGAGVRALPAILRTATQQLTSQVPLDRADWEALSAELQRFLGEAGFRWLSALAIYPALQWDLTLYLGIQLEDETGAPLYDEHRAAALTQLPWLREGTMPDWLRRRLIREMPAELRAAATRHLWALIEGLDDARASGEHIRLRLARDRARGLGVQTPDRLLKDAVFVETLAGERIDDLALRLPGTQKGSPLARLLDEATALPWPDVSVALAGLAFAAAGWWLAPKPEMGALPAGAFVPLAVLAAAGALCVWAASRRWGGYRWEPRRVRRRERAGVLEAEIEPQPDWFRHTIARYAHTAPPSLETSAEMLAHRSSAALSPGTRLGDYTIESVLGEGGFGITYKAHDSRLSQSVALKEYFPASLAQRIGGFDVAGRADGVAGGYEWGLERFMSEATTLARIQHQNIIKVHRLFKANNTAYIALQYLEGPSMKEWLRSLSRPPEQAELDQLVIPLLNAVEHVHSSGLVHRDIAPKNVIITPPFLPVLFDFGAARQLVGQLEETFAILLTPGYAPFELYVASGRDQGPWTDIYSFAATLYEAISGALPPEAPERVVNDECVPAAEIGRDRYRPEFLSAIDWGLRPLPRDRPQSIAEWRTAFVGSFVPPPVVRTKSSISRMLRRS